jgi:hypothetical protein
MEDKTKGIQALKKLLDFYKVNWDFEEITHTYFKLAKLNDYYYIELLKWFADASFLYDLHLLFCDKGVLFFEKYMEIGKLDKGLSAAINIILQWYKNIYLPILYKQHAENVSEHEKIILEFLRDNKFIELKGFMLTNQKELFGGKSCRDMVIVYALDIFSKEGLFDNSICESALLLYCSRLRYSRVVKLIIKNLDCEKFFALNIANGNHLKNTLPLIHRIHAVGGEYSRALILKIYSILDNYFEYVYPPQKTIELNTINAMSNKKPKVAVCISGMTRGLNTPIKSLYENIVLPLNADVFLSTWDIMENWPGLTGAPKDFLRRLFGISDIVQNCPKNLYDIQVFKHFFPNTHTFLNTKVFSPFDISFYTEHLDIRALKVENEEIFLNSLLFSADNLLYKGSYNQAKMFYKIYSALQLVLKYEEEHKFKYDYIIRTRPDIEYTQQVTFEYLQELRRDEVVLNYTQYGPSDQFWIGKRDVIVKLSSLWQQMLMTKHFNIFKEYEYGNHRLVLMYLIKQKLSIRKPPTQYLLAGATKDITLNAEKLKSALEKDFATAAAIYKDNEDVKRFFRFIAKDDSVC